MTAEQQLRLVVDTYYRHVTDECAVRMADRRYVHMQCRTSDWLDSRGMHIAALAVRDTGARDRDSGIMSELAMHRYDSTYLAAGRHEVMAHVEHFL